MTPDAAYKEALKRIETARTDKLPILDFGDLPIAQLPPEIVRLGDTLQVLALGYGKPVLKDGHIRWRTVFARDGPQGLDAPSLARLSALTGLRGLHFGGCSCGSDLAWVAPLTELRKLIVSPRRLKDLSPLRRLSKLQVLEVHGVDTSKLEPLSRLAGLRSLDVSGDGLSDLRALAQLTELQALRVDGGEVRDYRPLSGLMKLKSLVLRSDAQRDLSPLAKLTQLETFDITDGQISDLRPLSGLARLRELAFHFCAAVSDLRPLAGLTQLEKLTFNECESVTDLRPLSKLERLRRLDLTDCFHVANLKPLAKLKRLELLVLANTEVTDTSALNGLPKLRIRFGEEWLRQFKEEDDDA